MQLLTSLLFFFVLRLALSSMNFDVCSIDFVMLLLNGVLFSIIFLYVITALHSARKNFLMLQLCCPFLSNQTYFEVSLFILKNINLKLEKKDVNYVYIDFHSFSYYLLVLSVMFCRSVIL